jgi:EAL domain-containing protein (putative c-di-GMP-specific phosphodiesterase class I)
VERWQLENDLWQAIERREFRLYYQPIVALLNNQIVGGEAILRWQHRQRGLLEPQTFMELAEETGLIAPIGEWLIRAACAQLKAWRQAGHAGLRLAINLSSRQLQQPAFSTLLKDILAQAQLPPQAIELEITDKLSSEKENIRILKELQAIGLKISMDDFGVASSLNLLRLLPLSTLKIAPSFVRNIPTNAAEQTMVAAIIDMAHHLNLQVVAQGAQTEAHLTFLRSQRCDEIQGLFVSPPVSAENFTKLLEDKQSIVFPINEVPQTPFQNSQRKFAI